MMDTEQHSYIRQGNPKARVRLLLAHGAGAPMDSPFMDDISDLIAGDDLEVVRFEFPYMARRRQDGRKRPPDRAPVLLACFHQVIATWIADVDQLFIGGKSMGGRMASMIAAQQVPEQAPPALAGVVCLGYPFHAPGKLDRLRIQHLPEVSCPVLIIQGTRDALGNQATVEGLELGSQVRVNWLEDGDHDLKPRKASGVSHDDHKCQACEWLKAFCLSQT